MYLDYLIKKMEAKVDAVDFPKNNPGFETYQADLKRVLEENCGSAVAKSLVYCDHTQTFMVQVRVCRELTLPVRGPKNMPQRGNLDFVCVRTINPQQSISMQLGFIIDFVDQVKRQYADFAKTLTKS